MLETPFSKFFFLLGSAQMGASVATNKTLPFPQPFPTHKKSGYGPDDGEEAARKLGH